MNRMYVVEPAPTPTGGMADHRFVARGSQVQAWAWELATALNVSGRMAQTTGNLKKSPPSRAISRLTRARASSSPAIISRPTCMLWRTP